MAYCPNCGIPLQNDSVNFCPNCGTSILSQSVKEKNEVGVAALVPLCILTILGSVLGIIKGLFYQSMEMVTDDWFGTQHGLFGFAAALANAGTLTGAMFMLNRKRRGYTMYLISQIACIIISLIGTFSLTSYISGVDSQVSSFSVFFSAILVVPSLVFIALYTSLVKKQLGS